LLDPVRKSNPNRNFYDLGNPNRNIRKIPEKWSSVKNCFKFSEHTICILRNTMEINNGFIINATYLPAIMRGEKIYENRSFRIKPAYYALYASKTNQRMRNIFLESYPEMTGWTNREALKEMEGKIVGILHVKQVFKIGDLNYPVDPHATGKFTHLIDFIRIPDYIEGEHKHGQITYMSISDETKEKLSHTQIVKRLPKS
jgi:hypothetical protein